MVAKLCRSSRARSAGGANESDLFYEAIGINPALFGTLLAKVSSAESFSSQLAQYYCVKRPDRPCTPCDRGQASKNCRSQNLVTFRRLAGYFRPGRLLKVTYPRVYPKRLLQAQIDELRIERYSRFY